MKKVRVYRYRIYNAGTDETRTSTRMATKEKIKEIGCELIPGSDRKIDAALLADGWTKKDFDPHKPA
jgi:hypothetical protein